MKQVIASILSAVTVGLTVSSQAVDQLKPGAFDFQAKSVTLNSGYKMPIYGLGTYSLTGDTCITSVKSELENGGSMKVSGINGSAQKDGNTTTLLKEGFESMRSLGRRKAYLLNNLTRRE